MSLDRTIRKSSRVEFQLQAQHLATAGTLTGSPLWPPLSSQQFKESKRVRVCQQPWHIAYPPSIMPPLFSKKEKRHLGGKVRHWGPDSKAALRADTLTENQGKKELQMVFTCRGQEVYTLSVWGQLIPSNQRGLVRQRHWTVPPSHLQHPRSFS